MKIETTLALDAWHDANENCSDVSTGASALRDLLVSVALYADEPMRPIAIRLLSLYDEHGTDPDGVESEALYAAAAEAGWKPAA